MEFIEITTDGIKIDDSDPRNRPIIEALGLLIEKNGFDHLQVACGVKQSPGFGYFELADRFWRASLCIYSFGATSCFWERGAGYSEPWLYNARHAVELYLKDFLVNTIWLEELQIDPHLSIMKEEFTQLKSELGKPHDLLYIYNRYFDRLKKVIDNWNVTEIPEVPKFDNLVLGTPGLEMIKELDESDETSFRLRYPSLKQGVIDSLQKIDWHHDSTKIFPKTGLPKEAGYFFDHVFIINNLYKLVDELKNIKNYFDGITIDQDIMNEYWNEYLKEFENW